MSYGFGPLAHLGLEQAARLEYETFRQERSDHAALGQANWHRNEAQKWMKKGGKKGNRKAQDRLYELYKVRFYCADDLSGR